MYPRCRFMALLALFLILTVSPAAAATIHVPGDQPTIQAGVDAAVAGDSVIVASGSYTGPGNRDIDFGGTDIILHAAAGPGLTVIDCAAGPSDNARGIILESGESAAAVVSGFTIRNGYRSGTTFPIGFGAGIYVAFAGTNPTIINCMIENCQTEGSGAGIAVSNNAEPTFDGCIISGNTAGVHGGGAFASSNGTFVNCQFLGNEAGEKGGGLECFSDSAPTVIDCTFRDNVAGSGGAIANSFAVTTVSGSLFERNTSTPFNGGAVYCDIGSITLTDCVLLENVSEGFAGGSAAVCLAATLAFENCTLYANEASGDGAVAALDNAVVTIDNTIIAASLQSAAVHCDGTSTITLTCSDLIGNEGGDWTGCVTDQLGTNGNISADPLFCNIGMGDLQLSEGSPCSTAESGGCGLIGALDVSCVTAVEPTTWGAIKASFGP